MSESLPLQALEAILCGRPILRVPTFDPPATLEQLEQHLGPLPQAEWASGDGHHEIWVELPGLGQLAWEMVRSALPSECRLEVADPSGRRAAVDQGQLSIERWESGECVLEHLFDLEKGHSVIPHTVPGWPDEAVHELEREIDRLVRDAGLPRMHSDRGNGTLQPVLETSTGRVGFMLSWAEVLDPERLVSVLAEAVERRKGHGQLRLAATALLDQRLHSAVLVRSLASPAPSLPGDLDWFGHCEPPTAELPGLVASLDGTFRLMEVQVWPTKSHVEAATAVAALLEHREIALMPGPPRWVGPGRDAFVPTWVLDLDEALDDLEALDAMAALPQVHAIRCLPADPDGLEDSWEFFELGGLATKHGWLVRIHDGAQGRDLLVPSDSRPSDGVDERWDAMLQRALADAPGAAFIAPGPLCFEPVSDGEGRLGVEMELDATESMDPQALGDALEALLQTGLPGRNAAGHFGWRGRKVLVQLWRVRDVSPAGRGDH